ncbi:MAG: archaellin/type IV pilin N-terminal domain-containing protein [Candidatus Nanopusillus sp.]
MRSIAIGAPLVHRDANSARRKAISPIIATIILIVITVVAGAFLYVYATGMLHSSAASQVANVQSASLVVPGGTGAGTLTVTISNGGTVTITSVNVTNFAGQAVDVQLITTPIAPGQTASGTLTSSQISGLSNVVAGQSYELQLTVGYANGQTQVITTSVTASEYGS